MAHNDPYIFRLKVSKDELQFLKRLAKHDGISLHDEAQALFSLQIREEMDVQQEFMEGGEDK